MFQKLREAANGARLRAGQMWREHREKQEEKRTRAAMTSEHGHGRFFLLHVPAIATICAAIVEWYWAILFCIEATGHIDWNYETAVGTATAAASSWNFAFSTHWPVFVGLVLATLPIVMLSMVWLPVQFAMRGAGRWRRGTVIFVGVLANILVIVSGTVVMNHNRQDQVREAVVVEQSAAQGRAAIEARLAFEQEQLRLALTNTNPYLNQAASVGAEEWERSYVAQARATNDPRLPQLERALGAARAADERRANIERLTIERAQAAPEAASAAVVQDTVGAELNTFAQYVEVWRPPFIAVLATLIGIFGSWWVLALMQGLNPRDVLRSGWADEAHRIEDKRDEPSIVPQPMKPPREVVTDAETGEELIKVTPKPHWRKAKGKKQRVETPPVILPDETGVSRDGGGRVGSVKSSNEGHREDDRRTNEQNLSKPEAQEDVAIGENASGIPLATLSRNAGEGDIAIETEARQQNSANDDVVHPEPSDPPSLEDLPQDEVEALAAEIESAESGVPEVSASEERSDADDEKIAAESMRQSDDGADSAAHADDEQERADSAEQRAGEDQAEPSREPETNPAKLIAAE